MFYIYKEENYKSWLNLLLLCYSKLRATKVGTKMVTNMISVICYRLLPFLFLYSYTPCYFVTSHLSGLNFRTLEKAPLYI